MTSGMKNDSAMRMAARTTTSAMTTSTVVRNSGPRCSAAAVDACAAASPAAPAAPATNAAFPASKASVVSKADPAAARAARRRLPRAARWQPLQLLLRFLGFFLDLLAALLDVLAHARHRVAGTERKRSRQRGETIDQLLEHGSPFAVVEIMMTFAT